MAQGKIYAGAIGVVIDLFLRDEIPEGATVALEICQPNGTILSRAVSEVSSTRVQYITQADELNQAGCYRAQPVLSQAGSYIPGDTITFEVFPRFK